MASPKSVDCQKCRHFTGRNGLIRLEWGCAKGHAATSEYSTLRPDGCKDYLELSRDEQLFRRFKTSAEYRGDAELKIQQVAVRRAVGTMRKTLASFTEMMDVAQAHAVRQAIEAMDALGNDIERAAKLAAAHKVKSNQLREQEHARMLGALADQLLGDWPADKVLECARVLVEIDHGVPSMREPLLGASNERGRDHARAWLDKRRADQPYWSVHASRVQADLQAHEGAKTEGARAEAFASLRGHVAEQLEDFRAFGAGRTGGRATRDDFDAYWAHRREQDALQSAIDAAQNMTPIARPTTRKTR